MKFPLKEGIIVIRGKQENARYYIRLAVQATLAEKRPAELAKSLRAGAKEDVAEIDEPKKASKRNGNVAESPESSQLKGKPKNQ